MSDLRVGKVTKVDLKAHKVRVHFEDVNIESGWLKPISSANVYTVGTIVLCAYNPGFNEDGYVLGALE